MSEVEDFVEVNNELPYKQIKTLKIISVKYENQKFTINCKCEIADSVNDRQTIIRSLQDITWLIDNIDSNKKTYLSPKINTQTYMSMIYQKMGTQAGLKLQSEKRLSEKMVQRALVIITTIVLEHLKTLGDQYVYPIFIFFHKNFGLYKNPIYYKEELTPLSQKMGNYLWSTYAKLSNKSIGWEQLEKCKLTISNEMTQFDQSRQKLADYTYLLSKLQEQFIGQKQKIKNQLTLVEKLLLTYENEAKYLELVVQEITQTLIKIQNRSIVEQLMKQYVVYLGDQIQKTIKMRKQLVKEYVLVMCQHEERIKVMPH